jgi:hypothetical protein
MHNILPWEKSCPNIWATSVILKQCRKRTIAQLAKIRPIWSPWRKLSIRVKIWLYVYISNAHFPNEDIPNEDISKIYLPNEYISNVSIYRKDISRTKISRIWQYLERRFADGACPSAPRRHFKAKFKAVRRCSAERAQFSKPARPPLKSALNARVGSDFSARTACCLPALPAACLAVPSSVVKNHPNFCKSFILCFC